MNFLKRSAVYSGTAVSNRFPDLEPPDAAIRAAASTIAAASSTDQTISVDAAATAAADADHTIAAHQTITAASLDVNTGVNWNSLWAGTKQPLELAQGWQALKMQWATDEANWSFWIEWYEAVLEGTWTDWDLIFDIATTLKDEDWDKGAAHVAGEIAKLRKNSEIEHSDDAQTLSAEPSDVLKAAIASRVSQNRDAIALTVAGLLGQLAEYRERVRGLNNLKPEHRDELLKFTDDLSAKLGDLLGMLPENPTPVEPEDGGKFIKWLSECRALIPGVAKRYAEPRNVVEATFPVGIILGCTGLGAIIGGPLGATAGGVVGGLVSNQIKPGQAAKALLEEIPKTPDG